ncbi:MAG: cyclic nucleotide-binding domain-containing protein [Salibacteraceae bacterium]
MAFQIKRANTPHLLEQVFQLRHRVFVEQNELLQPTPDGRMVDRFDAYPTTNTFVVIQNEKVVGALRLALDCSEGTPADEYYDFRRLLPEENYVLHAGFFCVDAEFRSIRLTMGLMLMATYFAVANKVSHVFAPINPDIRRLITNIGFEVVGEAFLDAHTGVPMLPLLLNINKLNDYFMEYVQSNELLDFLRFYENWYYQKGESIIRAGTPGEEAFIVVDGTVQVLLAGTDQVLAELGQGEVFGELALLTDAPRTADVVAKDNVRLMVLPKKDFHQRFLSHPEQGLKLLGMMGKRTQALLLQLEEAKGKHTT